MINASLMENPAPKARRKAAIGFSRKDHAEQSDSVWAEAMPSARRLDAAGIQSNSK
jgi:hypothetical protein